jgi:hypothetical protein
LTAGYHQAARKLESEGDMPGSGMNHEVLKYLGRVMSNMFPVPEAVSFRAILQTLN